MGDCARCHRMAERTLEHRATVVGSREFFYRLRFVFLRRTHTRFGGTGMALASWIASANDPASDFPIQNLPYGVFLHAGHRHIGVAIGNQILDLHACADAGFLAALSPDLLDACSAEWLNPLMALDVSAWSELRNHLIELL